MKKEVKYQNLKDEMYLNRETNEDLGRIIGKSASTVSKKIAGDIKWNDEEIKKVCIHYKKPFEELFR